ncbi:MAG: phenylalanine--tRNA ligase subunit alpha [Planctomycetota bacterium]
MLTQVDHLLESALVKLGKAQDASAVEKVRVEYLGRKGPFKKLTKSLRELPSKQRSQLGASVNKAMKALGDELQVKLGSVATKTQAKSDSLLDVTLPGLAHEVGTRHPIYQVARRMIRIFRNLGFSVADGPEVEDEWHNFIGLNIPPDHIARDPSENFYLEDDLLLRSQTSTVQIRVMEKKQPPLRIIAPGKVYRPDTVDASHSDMFHQLEGLMVAEGVSFRDLKSTLLMFFRQMFHEDVQIRLRPSYFPFTEPSAEVDLSCPFCIGKGCAVCSRKGWVEMGGCGMVDPNVFEAVGYDTERYTGFAFGMGIDRITMAVYGIPDIRYLFDNDIRFLRQFGF